VYIVTATTACLVILALRAAAAPTIFAPGDNGNTKVLKLIQWVAEINDLAIATRTLPRALGISQNPRVSTYTDANGKRIKDWTDYLYDAPIWPHAKLKMEYTVFVPGAPAGSWRAEIRFSPDFNESEVCIHKADLISLFGQPSGSYVLTGGAGMAYSWVLRSSPYETIINGFFGYAETGCDPSPTIIEYPESHKKREHDGYAE
jgi:hypothetical protein